MKISFNETSLQTMFEYPSESSLAEEDEEEEEGHISEAEEDKACTFHIPRPNSTLHPPTPNSGEQGTVVALGGYWWCLALSMLLTGPRGSTEVDMLLEVTFAS